MSKLKIFDLTGNEIGSHDVRIDEGNFKEYKKQYGKQRAEGYADALRDLFIEFETDVIHDPKQPGNFFRNDNSTLRKAHEFYREKANLLEAVAKIMGDHLMVGTNRWKRKNNTNQNPELNK